MPRGSESVKGFKDHQGAQMPMYVLVQGATVWILRGPSFSSTFLGNIPQNELTVKI